MTVMVYEDRGKAIAICHDKAYRWAGRWNVYRDGEGKFHVRGSKIQPEGIPSILSYAIMERTHCAQKSNIVVLFDEQRPGHTEGEKQRRREELA